jgi:hypothetical protein
MTAPRERFRLELEALPSDTPAVIRLRAALKLFLRRFDLRCVSIIEAPDDDPADADQPP